MLRCVETLIDRQSFVPNYVYIKNKIKFYAALFVQRTIKYYVSLVCANEMSTTFSYLNIYKQKKVLN